MHHHRLLFSDTCAGFGQGLLSLVGDAGRCVGCCGAFRQKLVRNPKMTKINGNIGGRHAVGVFGTQVRTRGNRRFDRLHVVQLDRLKQRGIRALRDGMAWGHEQHKGKQHGTRKSPCVPCMARVRLREGGLAHPHVIRYPVFNGHLPDNDLKNMAFQWPIPDVAS